MQGFHLSDDKTVERKSHRPEDEQPPRDHWEHPSNHIAESWILESWWWVSHTHFLQKIKKSLNVLQDFVYYVPDVMCLTSVSHLGFLSYTFNLKVSLSTQFTIIIALCFQLSLRSNYKALSTPEPLWDTDIWEKEHRYIHVCFHALFIYYSRE